MKSSSPKDLKKSVWHLRCTQPLARQLRQQRVTQRGEAPVSLAWAGMCVTRSAERGVNSVAAGVRTPIASSMNFVTQGSARLPDALRPLKSATSAQPGSAQGCLCPAEGISFAQTPRPGVTGQKWLHLPRPGVDPHRGGSACPGALVAAGKDFASFFLRSWFSRAVGILHENNPVHPSG